MAVFQFKRGEWTEAYILMRLLDDSRCYRSSSDLINDRTVNLNILNIIHNEADKIQIFLGYIESNKDFIKITDEGESIRIVTIPEMSEYAKQMYDSIKAIVADGIISIKPHIGSSATLFNSSQSSGFNYEVVGCNEVGMHELNSKDAFLSIIEGIKANYSLKYVGCRNEAFEQNIAIVDSRMGEILNTAVLTQAAYYGACSSDVKSICNLVAELNPINVRNPQMFYPAKFKDFLFASFAGMTASTVWNGRKRLSGGYIDVSREGEMLYYRAISDDIFGNYLFENTYFDRPDRGMCKDLAVATAQAFINGHQLSEEEIRQLTYRNGVSGTRKPKKGDFGYVYQKDGRYYIDLNFQIRFR